MYVALHREPHVNKPRPHQTEANSFCNHRTLLVKTLEVLGKSKVRMKKVNKTH